MVRISKAPLISSAQLPIVPCASVFKYFRPTNNQGCPLLSDRLKIMGEALDVILPGERASNDAYL